LTFVLENKSLWK